MKRVLLLIGIVFAPRATEEQQVELTYWLAVSVIFISTALIAVILMQVKGEGIVVCKAVPSCAPASVGLLPHA